MAQSLLAVLSARRALAALACAAACTVFVPGAANAQIVSARVAVRGMTCTICSSAVERRLRKVACVQRATVNLERGLANLIPRGDKRFDGKRVLAAIRAAGFSPGDIEVVAEGTVSMRDGSPYLELPQGELALLRNAGDAGRAGRRVRVDGRFSDPSGDPRAAVAITVNHVEVAAAP